MDDSLSVPSLSLSSEDHDVLLSHEEVQSPLMQNTDSMLNGENNNGENDEISIAVPRPDEDKNELSGLVRNRKAVNYEALDYDMIENELYVEEERKMGFAEWRWIQVQRWIVCMLIGILTGLVAVAINIAIMKFVEIKMHVVGKQISRCVAGSCLYIPLLLWIAFNVAFVLLAALLTVFISPVAAGSGIPQIKCFLNGVKVPHVVRLKSLIVKMVGVIASVSGGLAVGKEGPMIHSGAVIAAGVSQGRSITFHFSTPFFKHFRNDREKRDFVCAGAAAGVSAAFGAPVGGVLFSLEEAASFWNQALTWRIFLCSILSSYTLNLCMSVYHGHPGDLAYPGLFNFGKFNGTYEGFELAIFFVMGVFGGLCGAAFIAVNHKITIYRNKYMKWKAAKVCEVLIVASISATIAFMMMYLVNDCKPLGEDPHVKLQFLCNDGQYNAMASLFFTTPEEGVKSLFHDPLGSIQPLTIFLFVIPYFFLACVTYGLQVPSGLFIPSLLIGAAWGRLVGMGMNAICPDCAWSQDLSKYSLIGAASQLGGTVRMTISLTVILIEATGNITYSLPLMTVLLVAKWVGDLFNKGIYDMHVHLARVPILEWDPPAMCTHIQARRVMGQPAVTLSERSVVSDVCSVLSDPNNCHSGYPVIDADGKFLGMVLRSQLLILLKHKTFVERSVSGSRLSVSVFRDSYPRYFSLANVNVSEEEHRCHIDLRPYLNPAPYTVPENASLPRIYYLFRALGLRHLVVINNNFEVVGMITRKDIYRWRRPRANS